MKENVIEGGLPRVDWTAVIAGVLAALAVHIVLGLFGLGFGFASATANSDGSGVITVIWSLLVAFVASLIGASIAVRIASAGQPKGAFLHGALVWCIGLIAGALFLTGSLASAAVSTGASAAGRRASLLPSAARVSRDARAEEAEKQAAGSAALGGLAALFGLGGALLGSELGRRELLGRPMLKSRGRVRTQDSDSERIYQGPISAEESRPVESEELGPRH